MTKNTDWLYSQIKSPSQAHVSSAWGRQSQLTKPQGSLGLLESIAAQFCGWQGVDAPQLNNLVVRVFAADHGVCAQGVSAFPQIVTTQMIANFCTGGAAVSVLSRHLNADFGVVNLGTAHPLLEVPLQEGTQLINHIIAPGTRDFSRQQAMSQKELAQALFAGRSTLEALIKSGRVDLFIGGEMGIGNTTSASAIYSALLNRCPELTVGPGTGVGNDGLEAKIRVIKQALVLHKDNLKDPLLVLQCVGGFEIAALVASYLYCAQRGIPVLVDGFICTAAALLAVHINPDVKSWFLFSHKSAEPAHQLALEYFDVQPLLDFGMRLGEGSGAVVAVPILKSAIQLHCEMATFAGASVSDGVS